MSERYRMPVDPTATNNPHSAALRLVGSGQRVLEVGCSVGHVTEHLVAHGNEVVGIELDPDAAVEARRFAAAVHVADVDATPLDEIVDGPFDVVVFGDVLEHLRDPARALLDARRLLDAGGRIVVSVPNIAHVDARLMLLAGRWDYRSQGLLDATHLRFFTLEGLRALLADAGLVATAIERVERPMFESNLEVDPDLYGGAVRRFVLTDPEALTFQFVVVAEPADTATGADVLARELPAYPPLDDADASAVADLRRALADAEAHNAALRAELDAWHRSLLVRATAPLRRLWAPIARRVRRAPAAGR